MYVRQGSRATRRGLAAAETAIVIPVFLTIVFGMIEMARMCFVSHLITTAASSGCRVATIGNHSQADITTTVSTLLVAGGIRSSSSYTVTTIPADVTTAHFGTPISVKITVPFAKVSWLGVPRYLKTTTLIAESTMSSERP